MKATDKVVEPQELPGEVWKAIPGYEGLYDVSNLGRVRSLWFRNNVVSKDRAEPKIVKQSAHNLGFLQVSISGGDKIHKRFLIHRLVLLAFMGDCPPDGFGFHKNSIKTDNRLENLEYRNLEQCLDLIKEGAPSPNDLDGEIWKFIPGFEGLYEVSNFGRVRSLWFKNNKVCYPRHFPHIMKDTDHSGGYRQIPIWDRVRSKQRFFLVHKLVMAGFHGWPPNRTIVVNHLNGNKCDNRLSNLEYCTPSENGYHAHRTGLISRTVGEHSFSKLTEDDVRAIMVDQRSSKEIGVDYGVCSSNIHAIKKGKSWNHITGLPKPPRQIRKKRNDFIDELFASAV